MRWICFLVVLVVIINVAQSQGLGNQPNNNNKWRKQGTVQPRLSSPSKKQTGGQSNKKPQQSTMNRSSLSQPKMPIRSGGRKTTTPGSNKKGTAGPNQMQKWMAMKANGVNPFHKQTICGMARVKPPVTGRMGNNMWQNFKEGERIRLVSKKFGHDLDIWEALAMCHNKEIEYRGCDKTPSPKGFGPMMPGVPGMGSPGPMGRCNINMPNSCKDPKMRCSQYHKDFPGTPLCCAQNEFVANHMEKMGW